MPMVAAGMTDEERERLQRQLSLEMQTRQAADRMRLFKKLVAKYGSGIVTDVEAHTIEQTRERMQAADLERRDLAAVKSLLWDDLGEGFTFRCVEDTPTRLAYEVTGCFLATEVARHDAARLGQAFYCAWDIGFCQGLNPRIRFTRTKTLMAGDPVCNHTYELPAADG
jgi:hypothetical protein